MLKIGDFSKLSHISIRMLRHYDEVGLLHPARVDDMTGYRYYSEDQLAQANRILALRDMGFGLPAIAEILSAYSDPEALQQYLQIKKLELNGQAESLRRQLTLLDTALKRLRKDESSMKYNVVLKEFSERTVASVRDIIPNYNYEGRLWHTLMQETAGLAMQPGDPSLAIAVFHDADYKETDVDVEIQMTVKGRYADTEHVRFRTEPPVLAATVTYQGNYEQTLDVNKAVADWVADNGYTLCGPMFNIYHVSPHETQNPDEWVTEACFPVAKRA